MPGWYLDHVFRVAKVAFLLMGLAAIVWFSVAVKLGPRTLVEHVRAIGDSDESQELVRGTQQKVKEVRNGVSDVLGRPELAAQEPESAQKPKQKPETAPKIAEDHSDEDREGLRRMIDTTRR